MNDKILVFGHKNPDTDSICSAIAYAELKKSQGMNAHAVRLGDISKETEFALKYFQTKFPQLIETVRPEIGDLKSIQNEMVKHSDSLQKALDVMLEKNLSSIPVIDDKGYLEGMISISEIASTYLELNQEDILYRFKATFENLKEVLEGEIISGTYPGGPITGHIKTVSDIDKISQGDILITTTDFNIDKAIQAGARCIIVCTDSDDEVIPRAGKECAIMKVNKSYFKTLKLITKSISISGILKNKTFYQFKLNDFIDEIQDIMKEADQTHFPVVDLSGKVLGSIHSKNLISYNRKKVILVDHNERSQSVDGVDKAQIMEIVDHHKFGNFATNEPLMIRADSVGCSSTIVYNLYKDADIVPSKKMAGLMLSAILSDTLLFKSPTCTEKDIEAAKELAEIADVDYKKYGMDMLIAGTSLGDKTPMEIITLDMKEFKMGELLVSVAQVNTVDVQGLLSKKAELMGVMNERMAENSYSASLLLITDIINNGSMVISIGKNADIVEKAFRVKLEDNMAWLENVVSRKKQVVPFLMAASQM